MTVVASNYARKDNDLYQTEPWATEALLRHFPLGAAWEPAAGNHLIADVMRDHGARVVTSDIVTYNHTHNAIYDFLKFNLKPTFAMGYDNLVTNPPYGKGNRDAVTFAELALTRCRGFVALLLTAKFDFGKTRMHLFRNNPRFAAKIALVDRVQWFPGATSGTEDHAWFVWRPADREPAPPVMIWEGRNL